MPRRSMWNLYPSFHYYIGDTYLHERAIAADIDWVRLQGCQRWLIGQVTSSTGGSARASHQQKDEDKKIFEVNTWR